MIYTYNRLLNMMMMIILTNILLFCNAQANNISNIIPTVIQIHSHDIDITKLNDNTLNATYYETYDSFIGSGVIISSNGYIIASADIVKNTNATQADKYFIPRQTEKYFIKTYDNQIFTARFVSIDLQHNLVLLKIEMHKMNFINAEISYQLPAIQDSLTSISHPMALGWTVRQLYVMNNLTQINKIMHLLNGIKKSNSSNQYLQVDSTFAYGDDAGGVFNDQGQLVGLIALMDMHEYVKTNLHNIGFIIPMSTIQLAISDMKNNAIIVNSILGVDIQYAKNSHNDKIHNGILINNIVSDDSIFQVGDIIYKINNNKIIDIYDFETTLIHSNDIMRLTIWRNEQFIELNYQNRKTPLSPLNQYMRNIQMHGATLVEVYQNQKNQLRVQKAIMVHHVINNARWSSLQKGDILISINQQPISTITNLKDIYTIIKKKYGTQKEKILLQIKRGNNIISLQLPI